MPSSPPTLSVGLPVYNGEDFVARALQSVLAQSRRDLEVVVSDNASTDGTGRICRELAAADPRVKYLRQPRNLGVTRNFMACVDAAEAKYFKWIAADDYLHPLFVERLLPALDDPAVAISTCRMPYTDRSGNRLTPDDTGWVMTDYGEAVEWVDYPAGLSDDRGRTRYRAFLANGRGNLFAELYYGIYRTAQVRRLIPPGYHIGTEKSFVAAALLAGRVAHLPEDLMFRAMHSEHFGGRTRARMLRGLNPDRKMPMWLSPLDQVWGYARQVLRAPGAPAGERMAALGSILARAFSPAMLGRFVKPGPANYLGREA